MPWTQRITMSALARVFNTMSALARVFNTISALARVFNAMSTFAHVFDALWWCAAEPGLPDCLAAARSCERRPGPHGYQ